jgi:hypothetical protein
MITLYHGSNVNIKQIDLKRSKKGKDFGCGFYLNTSRQQALDMAKRTARTLMTGEPIVNSYQFDDTILQDNSDLKIKRFDDYCPEWAEFVLLNRNNSTDAPAHPYDIVIGPIADDTVGVQIRRFVNGYIPMNILIEELRFRGNHAMQYFFGTEKAIQLLKKLQP